MNSSLSRRRLLMLGAQGVTASFVLAACSSTPPDSSDDPATLVTDADTTLSNFLRDPEMTWFRDNLPSARGVLIVPSFLRAGFIFGGAGGNGVLLVHDNAEELGSHPAFYTVAVRQRGLPGGGGGGGSDPDDPQPARSGCDAEQFLQAGRRRQRGRRSRRRGSPDPDL